MRSPCHGRRASLAFVGAMAVSSCTVSNPAYEGGDSLGGSTGVATDPTLGSDGEMMDSVGSGSGGASSSDSNASSDSVGTGICGDGMLDEGEGCDDGNNVDGDGCDANCRAPGDVEWSIEYAPSEQGQHRFNDMVLRDGNPIAVGGAVLVVGQPHTLVIVGYDAADGTQRLEASLEGDLEFTEAYGATLSPNRLYVSGLGETIEGQTALAAAFELSGVGDPLMQAWVQPLLGNTSRSLAFRGGELLVTVGNFFNAGHGLAALDVDGNVSWQWIETASAQPSQFETIVHVEGAPVVGGTLANQAILAGAGSSVARTSPWLEVMGSGPGSNRVQTAVSLESEVIAGGWLSVLGTDRDAWIGRYDLGGGTVWEHVFDGGSIDGDEVEAVALDGDRVIAVGMMGIPAEPAVWVLDAASGAVQWSRTYPEFGPDAAYFRGVGVDGDIFVAGERETPTGSVGIVARLAP